MSTPRACAAVIVLVLAGLAGVRAQDEIKKRQDELQAIRDQIKTYEEKIREQQKSERTTLELLDNYDLKGTLLRALITRLRNDEQYIQYRIGATRKGMEKLEGQLAFLKKHYAAYVTSIYKTGRTRDLELLISSSSINQVYIRNQYLKRFTEQRKRDAEGIGIKRKQVEEKQAQLNIQLTEEQRLIAEKGSEEERLAELAADRRDALEKIRKDKKNVQREIDRQMRAAKELEGMIAQLIEADRVRKEREAEEARRARIAPPVHVGGGFENRKGKLRWPVSEGTVVAHFGNQTHPTLKTVTQNTGIDIAAKVGSPVSTVADGEISKIWWLPSYGNLVIIDHGGSFYTVYTHLGEINSSEGEKVKEGDVIGYTGEALNGPRLHFEIWKGKEKQNPEQWLGRQ
ncbi:MAG TPA: peptidoglycan DD-metalloendopeptidase family protein [Bacteroidota bacterium]|nr:peptidoglycan DD-metalloendopeptidase family protein [Bacteroidota bacterium]